MGCCGSKVTFGEVREKMCHALQLQDGAAFSPTPSHHSTAQRDVCFARIQQLSASLKEASPQQHAVRVSSLLQYARDTWQLPQISPLNLVFGPHLAFAYAHDGNTNACATPDSAYLMRWHFRPWLMSMCEVYRVLSLLERHKILAKPQLSWFRSACTATKSNTLLMDSVLKDNNKARAFVAYGEDMVIGRQSLTAAFLRELQREMPGVLDTTVDAANVVSGHVWEQIRTGVHEHILRRRSTHAVSATNPLRETFTEKAAPDSVSAIALVEWLAMRCCAALSGMEDSKATYVSAKPCAESATGDEEEPDIELVLHCDALRALLDRLHALDRQIDQLGEEDELRARLQDERHRIHQILLRLFRHLSRNTMRLSEEETCLVTYCELDAHLLYPERAVHDAIVKDAFSRAVLDKAATDAPSTEETNQSTRQIADLSKFTAYLDAYLGLQGTHNTPTPSTPPSVTATPVVHQATPSSPSTHSPLSTPTAKSGNTSPAEDANAVLDTPPQRRDTSWWSPIADSIPYTSSTPHRQARRDIILAVNEARQHEAAVMESADGYLPTNTLATVLRADYKLDRVAHYFYEQSSSESDEWRALSTNSASGEHDEVWETWFRSCVCATNQVVGRADLDGEEVHPKDLRFLLQYIHHYMTIFSALHTSALDARSTTVRLPTSPEQRCSSILTDLNDTFRDAFSHVVASLSSEAVAQIVTAKSIASAICQTTDQEHDKDDTHEADREGVVNMLVAARLASAALVKISYSLYDRTQRKYREMVESDNLKAGVGQDSDAEVDDEDDFACTITSMRQTDCGTYWELLRLFLPYGTSSEHRSRRRQLFDLMDVTHKGYLTLADLNRGISTVLPLRRFRADLTPVLFRAFTAVKEIALVEDKVIFLTREEESFITQREFAAFLYYFYRYMELYYMFDALTCSNHIQLDTLHVTEEEITLDNAAASPLTDARTPLPKHDSRAVPSSAEPRGEMEGVGCGTAHPHTPATALCALAATPYQLTVEAVSMPKQVTLEQFRVAHSLLRRWGVHVKDFESVFRQINERCRKGGEMYFTWFAVWASEHNLRPEGYGYGFTEQEGSDLFASLESQFASLHMKSV